MHLPRTGAHVKNAIAEEIGVGTRGLMKLLAGCWDVLGKGKGKGSVLGTPGWWYLFKQIAPQKLPFKLWFPTIPPFLRREHQLRNFSESTPLACYPFFVHKNIPNSTAIVLKKDMDLVELKNSWTWIEGTPWKINGWNLQITHEKKGKGKWSSKPSWLQYVPC